MTMLGLLMTEQTTLPEIFDFSRTKALFWNRSYGDQYTTERAI
ncbi:hypothetical protein DFR46_2873 [Parasphingopyxis lamellibrachiae]|uniref:Uncharacterized protein n=2 Tax=Parasphingopyxis lamellibrachiae TaxID=680125 RepID=A0A3D9FJI3_9SPHN|nr:hypothetical protein DFR46_2873 [Parasphingopyxis lamellibrachiae]